ncbi:MAG: hypothetical protein HZA89_10780 [Verrucomicrobia bacterium]|nr:hypothetical protein [Verrucomicrobiota bacterium]
MAIGNIEFNDRAFMEKVRDAIRKRGRYAGHREGGDKPIKERAIVCEFLRAQEIMEGSCWIRTVQANPDRNAAPDCFGTNIQGDAVAYEVTELVDKGMIEQNLPKISSQPMLYITKEWQPDELIQKVQAILKRKDSRDFKGAIFEKVILIIHTAEPALRHGHFFDLLSNQKFDACRKIDEAFILFAYSTRRRNYSYLPLRLG